MIVSWLHLTRALHSTTQSHMLLGWKSLLCWYKGSESLFNLCLGRGKTSRQTYARRRIYFDKFLIPCSNLNTCMYFWSPRRRGWSQRAPPPPQCAFTLLIPEGPRVWHSRHSDLSPSSLLIIAAWSLHNHFTATEDRGNPSALHGRWDSFDSGWIKRKRNVEIQVKL